MKLRTILTESVGYKPDPKTLKLMMIHFMHDDTAPVAMQAKVGPKPDPDKFFEVFTDMVLEPSNQYLDTEASPDKKSYPWLCKQYALGTVEIENILSRAGQAIWSHRILSQKNLIADQFKDLNAFQNFRRLEVLVNKHADALRAAKEEEKLKNIGKLAKQTKIYEDDRVEVFIPMNKESAIVLARSAGGCFASWCTGGLTSNYFDYYGKQGPLVVILYKHAPCDKVQFHVESGQFMDKNDDRVNLASWGAANPGLMQAITDEIVDMMPALSTTWSNISSWDERVKRVFGNAFVEKPVDKDAE